MRNEIKKVVPHFLADIYRNLRAKVIEFEFELFSNLPIRKKRVVFCNVWGYGDNPKWIARALRFMDKSMEVVFITDTSKIENPPEGIKFIRTNTATAIKYLSTARVWVDCNRKEPYIHKRSGQYYIQTWHGNLPLKRIEGDCADMLGEKYIANAQRDSKMTDVFLTSSEFFSDLIRNAFYYKGQIEMTGSPRLDPLFRPNAARVIRTRERLGITDKSTGIVIYAPTYRETGGGSEALEAMDYRKLGAALEKRFGRRFVIVTRLHPLAVSRGESLKADCVVDGNRFGDIYELLEAADVLVTDYSNTLFEFAYTGKPVFLFAPDAREYIAERGMYFDYLKLPYPRAATMDELSDVIKQYDPAEYADDIKDMFRNLGIREDGKAAVRVANMIIREVYRR